MPYLISRYLRYGNPSDCVTDNHWWPGGGGDANDGVRNDVTSAYMSIFGRYGELSGVEGYVATWVYGTGPEVYGSIYNMVYQGGIGSGELAAVNAFGRHTGMSTSSCPVFGCTDPTAVNYNPSATINDGSCYYAGCTNPNANNYNPSASIDDGSCTFDPPTVSLSIDKSSIILGESATITWSASGYNITSYSLTDVALTASNQSGGSIVVYPTSTPTTTYTYTACNIGGCSNANASITVYIPPTISFTSSLGTSIVVGQTTNISWTVSGDANTISWTSGDITNTNLSSNSNVSPGDTTTYCAVASGLGGVSPNTCIKITVNQRPTGSLTVPAVVNYNENFNIEYDTKYANTSIEIIPTYQYLDGTSVTGTTINRTAATGSELSNPDSDTVRTGTVPITVPWNNFGPFQVDFTLIVNGLGGSDTILDTTAVYIDKTPDNIAIEETDEALKDQDPVYTPESEVLSEMYFVDDIDIPVEVKSDYPILVDVNKNGSWTKIRQIGAGLPSGGSSLPSEGSSFPTEPGVYHIKPSSTPSEPPLIAKGTALTAEDYATLITCVSVIDETQSSYYNNLGNLNNVWQQSPAVFSDNVNDRRGFRTAFPYRTFYILDPQGSSPSSGIDVPTNYPSDPNAFGPIVVNRDGGNVGSRSDWFDICNFDSLPYGTIVSIWIDISGSMTLATVQASYDYFLARCAAAGIEIVLSLSAAGERYIEGHIQYLPPSANFNARYTDSDGNTYVDGSNGSDRIEIISGDSVELNWIVFGDVTDMSVSPGIQNSTSDFSNYVKTITVNPTTETTYDLIVNGPAGSTTRSVTVYVLIPPTITILSTQGLSIIAGECTTLTWSVSGDGNSVAWTQGSITNTNVNSSETVCPDDTTTYCAVASGPGGVSPETCITITVFQQPTASITAPAVTDYSVDFTVDYETQYANSSISIVPTYTYLDGSVVTGTTINRTAATSAEINGGSGGTVNDTIANGTGAPITVPWNNFGPYQIDFVITADGTGGSATDTARTLVNIDQTPENFTIDETDEVLKNQDPVYTPESEILSEMYLINDIDIPVEIKADYPIKVDINKNNDWEDVRRI